MGYKRKLCDNIIAKMEWWRNVSWAEYIDDRTKDEVITVMQNVVDSIAAYRQKYEPPEEKTVNEITLEMIEAVERNEKRIKERVDQFYDELIAEKRAEIERLEAEIAKMPPSDAEKLAAVTLVTPKEADA